jgi:hypothetical protein
MNECFLSNEQINELENVIRKIVREEILSSNINNISLTITIDPHKMSVEDIDNFLKTFTNKMLNFK